MDWWLLVAIGPWIILGLVATFYVGRWISKRPIAVMYTAQIAVVAIIYTPLCFGGYR